MREFSYTGSIHFRQFPATLVLWQKGPLPQDEGNYFTLDYHFRQFPATLVYVAEKPPPPRMREFFLHWIYPFQVISSNFGFCGRKAPPHPHQDEGNFFTLDLSISGNFEQCWFLWQKSPLPLRMREIFLHWIYPFQAISNNCWILWQKSLLPPWLREIFLHWIYPFQAISSNFGFCGRKPLPPSPRMRENIFTLDLSISGNFEQLWFLWQKAPPQMRGFLHWIYPFQQFSATLVFVVEKPPPGEGKLFYTGSIHFRQFPAILVFVAEKPPPPQDEGKFFRLDLSISGNFQQLWFLWQKSPPRMR